jgi:hypothetical protein
VLSRRTAAEDRSRTSRSTGAGSGAGSGAAERSPVRAERDPRRWWQTLFVGCLLAAGCAFYTFWWEQLRFGRHQWMVAGDLWMAVHATIWVNNGAYPYLYQAHNQFYALPLSVLVLAPVVALGNLWHLSVGYPVALPYPSMFLLVGPLMVAIGVIVLYAVRSLAFEAGVRRGLLLLQMVVAAAVVFPAFYLGHFEDLMALAFASFAIRQHLRGHLTSSALLLGLAICSKQWVLLAVPVLAFRLPRAEAGRYLLRCALPVVLLAGPPLALDFHHSARALLEPITPLAGTVGHLSLTAWLGGAASRWSRSAATVAAVVIGWKTRRRPNMLELVGLVWLLRALTEPVLFAYYLGPGIALCLIAAASRDGRVHRGSALLAVAAVAWSLPASPATGWWWCGEALLLVAFGVSCVLPETWLTRSAAVAGRPIDGLLVRRRVLPAEALK